MNPSMYHGEINPGFMGDNLSIAGSRKSGGLQPVMLMPHGPVPDERLASICNVGLTVLHSLLSGSLSTLIPPGAASLPSEHHKFNTTSNCREEMGELAMIKLISFIFL